MRGFVYGCVLAICIGLVSPVCVYAEVDVEIGIKETFDDNIDSASSNEKDDFITSIYLTGKAVYETKTDKVSVTGNMVQNLFMDHSEYDKNSQILTCSYEKYISKFFSFDVFERFSHGDEPVDFENSFGRPTGRYSQYNNEFAINGTYDVNQRLQIVGTYGNTINRVPKSRGSDTMMNRVRINSFYSFDSTRMCRAFYECSVRSYKPGGTITRQSIGGALRYYVKPYLYGDGGMGCDFLDSNGLETKPQFFCSVTNEFSETTYLVASFNKSYSAQTYSEEIFKDWRLSCTLGHQLLERLHFSSSLFFGKGTYQQTGLRDTLSGGSMLLRYDFANNIRGTLSYSVSQVDSNMTTREYVRNIVSLGVNVTF